MAEGVATNGLVDSRSARGVTCRTLDEQLADMVPSCLAGAGIDSDCDSDHERTVFETSVRSAGALGESGIRLKQSFVRDEKTFDVDNDYVRDRGAPYEQRWCGPRSRWTRTTGLRRVRLRPALGREAGWTPSTLGNLRFALAGRAGGLGPRTASAKRRPEWPSYAARHPSPNQPLRPETARMAILRPAVRRRSLRGGFRPSGGCGWGRIRPSLRPLE